MKRFKKIGGIIIKNNKILVVRKKRINLFIFPGGKMGGDETSEQTLKRQLNEELGVRVSNLRYFGTFVEPSALEENMEVELEIYFVDVGGKLNPESEIEKYKWIDSSYKKQGIKLGSVLEKHTPPKLIDLGMIK